MKSLESNHNQDRLLELVGKILENQGQLDNAVKYYVHAIRENPHVLDYYLTLCELYQKRREFQQAIGAFAKKQSIAVPSAIEPLRYCQSDYEGRQGLLGCGTDDPQSPGDRPE